MMRRQHQEETHQRALEYLAKRPITMQHLNDWRRRFENGPEDEDEDEADHPPSPPPPPEPRQTAPNLRPVIPN
ncbi:uncharacterized protein SETTUDRAFT_167386, partial [Exserohilum turcica Et28A]